MLTYYQGLKKKQERQKA